MTLSWDYTDLAAHYDKRADYSAAALEKLFGAVGLRHGDSVADIGAGTGKLSVPLARRGFIVAAVEPNAAMRGFGIRNTKSLAVTWSDATAERTGLAAGTFTAATFGSSFNVVNQAGALTEAARILKPDGCVACMWNHRNLDDALQSKIEALIREELPEYRYGSRREDPTPVIDASGLFGPVSAIEDRFAINIAAIDFLEAWRSHATLQRQAGARFPAIIARMEHLLDSMPSLSIPYFTRIWYAARSGALTK